MRYRVVLGCVLLLGIISLPAVGQQRGQYLPGFGGLNSGLQARNRTQGVTVVFAIGKTFK